MSSLTVVVLTRNEERNLPRALASVPGGAHVLVVDAESRDSTAALARAMGAEVVVRPWNGYIAAREAALRLVRTEWTLMLDADEACDAELRGSIEEALAAPLGVAGFTVRRRTWFCGRPIRGCGWGDERIVRLIRTKSARVRARPAAGGTAALHEYVAVDGPAPLLAGTIEHYSYPSVASYREKFDCYTSLEAAGLTRSPAALLAALVRTPLRFLWLFLVRDGWRDGRAGAFIAWHSALYPLVAQCKAYTR